MEDENEIIGED